MSSAPECCSHSDRMHDESSKRVDTPIVAHDHLTPRGKARQAWASDDADPGELVQLEQWRKRDGRNWNLNFRNDPGSMHTPAERLLFSICPEDKGDCDCAVSLREYI